MDITHLSAVLALLVAPMQILANRLVNICQHTVYNIIIHLEVVCYVNTTHFCCQIHGSSLMERKEE